LKFIDKEQRGRGTSKENKPDAKHQINSVPHKIVYAKSIQYIKSTL